MSTRASLRDWLANDPSMGERECALCGGDWSALGVAEREIHVCARCAVEILPRLIADAVWRRSLSPLEAETIAHQVRAEFWRGIALAVLRAREGAAS